ncbi:uncharacterized protein RAG0_11651 [Rhynchosporium agropyri]|uniref:Uncharacterized protein n=1 Tax=Rhynchosporium agropyri TaxID=914238 RepID=A0A1E1L554_9HELO|nr:uncharacterized protein RAG0_11651 [Rhynchosporium agropyri]
MPALHGTMRIDRASQNSEDQPTDVVEAVTSPHELQAQLQSTIMYSPISAFASPETAISQLEVPPWYHPGEIHALPRIGSRATFPNLEASLSRTEHDFHNRRPIFTLDWESWICNEVFSSSCRQPRVPQGDAQNTPDHTRHRGTHSGTFRWRKGGHSCLSTKPSAEMA